MESGVRVRGRSDLAAQRTHVRLALRAWPTQRGLPSPGTRTVTPSMVAALIDTGASELHVAEYQGRILASALVLVSAEGATIHSLGLSREGGGMGAGHQLLAHVSADLRQRGVRCFTLGDADESHAWVETLIAGFATDRVQRESVRITFGPAWSRKLGTLARVLRERPAAFLPAVLGRLERYVAYVARPADIPEPEMRPELRVERLDYTRLAELARQFPDAVRHHDRAKRLGYSAAFGVFADGELAHISWLVLADDDARNTVRNVWVRPGEAEIGPCSTFPAHRGRGLYPFIIRELCRVAAERGIQHVFMITSSRNYSSQRGIEKAGFRRCGSIYRFVFPYLGERSLTLRGHRLWLALHRPSH
jgi:ribosomal protein S18 acetylase RimI-like enzyme